MDVNEEIMDLIRSRLEIGKERYGHGIVIDDDTTKYGTERSSWTIMALEEILDMAVYVSARLIQVLREEERRSTERPLDDGRVLSDAGVRSGGRSDSERR